MIRSSSLFSVSPSNQILIDKGEGTGSFSVVPISSAVVVKNSQINSLTISSRLSLIAGSRQSAAVYPSVLTHALTGSTISGILVQQLVVPVKGASLHSVLPLVSTLVLGNTGSNTSPKSKQTIGQFYP